MTRRAGKRSLSFAEGLISGERRPVSIRVRQKPNGTGRSRRLGREFSVAKRGDFGVLKRISQTKTLRKSRRTTKKTSFRVRFFDGLGLLKSTVVSLETSKRPDAKRRKTRLSTEKPPNFKRSTVKSPVRTINSRACGRVLRRNGRALKDAAGALRSVKKCCPSRRLKKETNRRTDVWSRRRSRFGGRLDNLGAALNASRFSS